MSILKIIKENDLKIPIGSKLHFHSFFDKISNSNPNSWDSIGYYIWQDNEGKLHTINQNILYPKYKDYYINVIVLSNLKFAYQGEEYWKVILTKQESIYHKLEFHLGKHLPAICFKPYKGTVYNSTNSMFNPNIHRFQTEEEALYYISKIDDKYIKAQL